jgi:GT2 family glycosyltransferase
MGRPTISVICLSYNRPQFVDKAIRSILGQTLPADEVLVVDNASPSSGEIRQRVAAHEGVHWVGNPVNSGFAGGMNLGIQLARGDLVLLTEDDLELSPDCLEAMRAGIASADLCGGVLIDTSTGRMEPVTGRLDFARGYWGGPHYVHRDSTLPADGQPFACDFVQGCLLFARRSTFLEHGGFRPDYFVYDEDVELCARWRSRGLRIQCVPGAVAHHLAPHHRPLAGVVAYHHEKNFLTNYFLYAPLGRLPEVFLRFIAVRCLLHALRGEREVLVRHLRASRYVLGRLPRLFPDRHGKKVPEWRSANPPAPVPPTRAFPDAP